MSDADLYFDGEVAAVRGQQPVCEVCRSADDMRMAPIMTGVPFNAPRHMQRFVCGPCVGVWYENGADTAEKILAIRGIAA